MFSFLLGVSCMARMNKGLGLVLLLCGLNNAVVADETPEAMILIPAGPFIMGGEPRDDDGKAQEYGSTKPWYVDESPKHRQGVEAFWIDTFEVTNSQYRDFVIANNYWIPNGWQDNGYLLSREVLGYANLETLRRLATDTFKLDLDTSSMEYDELMEAIVKHQSQFDNLPVTGVTWFQARDFCVAQGKRLPTEVEWEKAARGIDGREYPWGNEWDETRLNIGSGNGWEYGVAPVGSYPNGVSPYGVHDMAGNVMEWTADWYQAYAGSDYKSEDYGEKLRVVRGGGWGGLGHYVISHFYRTAYRFNLQPTYTFVDLGFRCARDEN